MKTEAEHGQKRWFQRARVVAAGGLVVLLLVVGVIAWIVVDSGSTVPATATRAAASTGVESPSDACGLLTAEEIAGATGERVTKNKRRESEPASALFDVCVLEFVDRPGVEDGLQVQIFSTSSLPQGEFATDKERLHREPEFRQIPSLGLDAYAYSNATASAVVVLLERYILRVNYIIGAQRPHDATAILEQLARHAAKRAEAGERAFS